VIAKVQLIEVTMPPIWSLPGWSSIRYGFSNGV
jgi:hypothetical protein